MKAATINKRSKNTVPQLLKKAAEVFNQYSFKNIIMKRCIICKKHSGVRKFCCGNCAGKYRRELIKSIPKPPEGYFDFDAYFKNEVHQGTVDAGVNNISVMWGKIK